MGGATKVSRADWVFRLVTAACASVVVVLMGGILLELLRNSGMSLRAFGVGFLASSAWNPGAGSLQRSAAGHFESE